MNKGFIDACEALFLSGNKWALMQVINLCAQESKPLPAWAAAAYMEAFKKVQTKEVKSWDDVFGAVLLKGQHRNSLHKKNTKMWELYNYAQQLLNEKPSTPVDLSFFDGIGKRFNVGRTLASEYYYEAQNVLKDLGLLNK